MSSNRNLNWGEAFPSRAVNSELVTFLSAERAADDSRTVLYIYGAASSRKLEQRKE
jgi:hypothetical protein